MQLQRLLIDATECAEGSSQRSQHVALAEKLNARHGAGSITVKGVAKWFERGAIPGPWLMKIAALPKKSLNLADYT